MPTNRTPLRRRVRGQLSSDQEMALWLGVGPNGDPFEDEDERRDLWFRHRGRLMAEHATGGRRPLAWWRYESPIPWPGHDRERSALYEAGELGEQAAGLVAWWRSEFERASKPGFSYCQGPDRPWLTGAAARRAHFVWADIPASLVARWTEERRKAAGAELVGESSQNYEAPE